MHHSSNSCARDFYAEYRLSFLASSVGDWKVEIKDANDNLLTTVSFKVE